MKTGDSGRGSVTQPSPPAGLPAAVAGGWRPRPARGRVGLPCPPEGAGTPSSGGSPGPVTRLIVACSERSGLGRRSVCDVPGARRKTPAMPCSAKSVGLGSRLPARVAARQTSWAPSLGRGPGAGRRQGLARPHGDLRAHRSEGAAHEAPRCRGAGADALRRPRRRDRAAPPGTRRRAGWPRTAPRRGGGARRGEVSPRLRERVC
jgi:hypothetical protein